MFITREALLEELHAQGVLEKPAIAAAFAQIDRADFVPEHLQASAYINAPLPIGHGQTISQPYTVAFMLDQLDPLYGDTILDVGSGSGWQTALLAHIVSAPPVEDDDKSDAGAVFGIELVRELHEQSITNISRYNYIARGIAHMACQNAAPGLPDHAPFNGIIAAAAVEEVPPAWTAQLAAGGRLVLPVGGSIWTITKGRDGTLARQEFPGFAFVPFIP